MQTEVGRWMKLSKFNLLVVAALGTIMRYKIGYELPFIDQKFTQHAHSHFAFAAWITQTLMVFMIGFLENEKLLYNHTRYKFILWSNTISGYGMLVCFLFQGYSFVSIAFSQISIFAFYLFAYEFNKDISNTSKYHPSYRWFKAALLFGVVSSVGPYILAYMLASKNIIQEVYLGSVYFYLHFQYNGWFLFASLGLLISAFRSLNPEFDPKRMTFVALAGACIPAYLLSVLWLQFPTWLLVIIFLAATSQLIAWANLYKVFRQQFKKFRGQISSKGLFLFSLIGIAFTIKLFLQLGSTIPLVSKLAFGFRPIIIAYLHLVLLGIITMFLLTYYHGFLKKHRTASWTALLVFAFGVYSNEIALTVQGVASFSYTVVPRINDTLLAITAIILLGSIWMWILELQKDRS